ncbi:MAG: TonB-dependent receptor [Polaromonas sp.]|nr:TonB-dependent receptor [Polaromonas sp.]
MKRFALITATMAAWASPTHAQALDPMVVTGSRSEQRSFDAPAAIQSIGREVIENAGPQVNLSESLNRVPGLTILNRQNYAQDLQLSIRGFGSRAAFGVRGIRLLIDGIPATTPDGQGQGSSVSLTSTDRVEVLRGPLALLYGNSSGGVVQAFTRDAPDVPEFSSQLYTGSFGLRRSDWQYAGKVGQVGLVADYSTFEAHGFRANSRAERQQFNGKLSFAPNDRTHVNVVFNHFDMPLAEDPLGLTAAQLATNPQQAGTNASAARVRKITRQSQLGSAATFRLDSTQEITARAYVGTRSNLQYQANNTWVGLDRTYRGVGLQYAATSTIATLPVRWVAGYELDDSSEGRQGGTATVGEKNATSPTRNENNTARNSDFFVQATSALNEQFSLVTGLRASSVRLVSSDYLLTDGDGSGSVRYRASSPVLGLTWHAADTLNLYANYGKGFETPTLAEVAYRASNTAIPTALFNPGLAASRSQHYELGAKWLASPASRVDANVYQIDSTDEIVTASSAAGRTAFKNAPGTRRRGVELAANTLLGANVSAQLAANWIDARFSQSYANNIANVASGNRLPGIPQHFIFSELAWSSRSMVGTPAHGASAQLGSRAGLELTRAGKLYANDVNTAQSAGYTLLATRVSHGWSLAALGAPQGVLTAYARIDNLTDRRYVGSVIVNQAAGQFYEPAPGRNYTLGLKVVLPL